MRTRVSFKLNCLLKKIQNHEPDAIVQSKSKNVDNSPSGVYND